MKKQVIAALLALILAFVPACQSNGPETPGPDNSLPDIVTPTDIPLIENGTSEYSIVIPADSTVSERFAAEELQFFIADATGATLPIVSDEGLSFDESAKVLSVGHTAVFEGSGLTAVYEELNTEGFKIRTYGNTVVMTGAHGNGTLYAAYGFLERNFDYRYYAVDEWSITDADTVMLMDMNVTDRPTFNGRWLDTATWGGEYEWATRARLTGGQGVMLDNVVTPWSQLNDQSIVGQLLPYDTYKDRTTADGKPWMSGDMDTGQLCLSVALNDEECFNILCDNLINNYVSVETERKIFMLGINDTRSYCQCDDCKAGYEKYLPSGMRVQFANKVADRVQEWIDENAPGREFYICIFAYLFDLTPPVRYDSATGKYIPLDDSVVCNDNVMVRIAPIDSVNMYPHTDMDNNPAAATAFAGWTAVASNLCIWDYGTNFNAYLAPYPDWGTMQENFQLYDSIGVSDILTQLPAHTSGTAFYAMKIFLRSQLMWNAYQDFDTLVNDFIDNYYKSAAGEIREYYDYLRAKFETMREADTYDGDIYGKTLYTCWTYDEVLQMERMFDRAFAANEAIKETDPDTYARINERLTTETLFYRYVLINRFSSYYPRSEVEAMIDSFEIDAFSANLTGVGREVANNPSSNDLLTNVISGWRTTLI